LHIFLFRHFFKAKLLWFLTDFFHLKIYCSSNICLSSAKGIIQKKIKPIKSYNCESYASYSLKGKLSVFTATRYVYYSFSITQEIFRRFPVPHLCPLLTSRSVDVQGLISSGFQTSMHGTFDPLPNAMFNFWTTLGSTF
jgi:hypothetical protein